MNIQNSQLSFIPWIPEGEFPECPICRDTLSEPPAAADQLPIKHEGHLGSLHPMHLACCLECLKYSDLCSYCKSPLNSDHLTLLLDDLETRDLTALTSQNLQEIAEEANRKSKTPEGQLKSAAITLEVAKKAFDSSVLLFRAHSERYKEVLKNMIDLLREQPNRKCLESEQVLQKIEEDELPEAANTFASSRQQANDSLEEYQKGCRAYVIKELEIQGRLKEAALRELFLRKNPLSLAVGEGMQQRSIEFTIITDQLDQIVNDIQALGNLYIALKEKKAQMERHEAIFIPAIERPKNNLRIYSLAICIFSSFVWTFYETSLRNMPESEKILGSNIGYRKGIALTLLFTATTLFVVHMTNDFCAAISQEPRQENLDVAG
jgi:hypothetical protein